MGMDADQATSEIADCAPGATRPRTGDAEPGGSGHPCQSASEAAGKDGPHDPPAGRANSPPAGDQSEETDTERGARASPDDRSDRDQRHPVRSSTVKDRRTPTGMRSTRPMGRPRGCREASKGTAPSNQELSLGEGDGADAPSSPTGTGSAIGWFAADPGSRAGTLSEQLSAQRPVHASPHDPAMGPEASPGAMVPEAPGLDAGGAGCGRLRGAWRFSRGGWTAGCPDRGVH